MNGKYSPMMLIDIIVGILMIIVALVLHLAIPGIPFALLLIGGFLLVLRAIGSPGINKLSN